MSQKNDELTMYLCIHRIEGLLLNISIVWDWDPTLAGTAGMYLMGVEDYKCMSIRKVNRLKTGYTFSKDGHTRVGKQMHWTKESTPDLKEYLAYTEENEVLVDFCFLREDDIEHAKRMARWLIGGERRNTQMLLLETVSDEWAYRYY